MLENDLILPIKTPLDGSFGAQLDVFIAQSASSMPTPSEAALLKAAAGNRKDQRVAADYTVGMVWLTWRFARCGQALDAAINASAPYVSSRVYLQLQQQKALFKHLPLFNEPRPKIQSVGQLEHEARIISYLKTGRL
ncbi:MAG: hypothetical protein ACYCY3_06305 [Halothiobacillus sp.]